MASRNDHNQQSKHEPRAYGDAHNKSPTHATDEPEVNPDTRSSAHDSRHNTGNGSHDINRAPLDTREPNTPRPKPRDSA